MASLGTNEKGPFLKIKYSSNLPRVLPLSLEIAHQKTFDHLSKLSLLCAVRKDTRLALVYSRP